MPFGAHPNSAYVALCWSGPTTHPCDALNCTAWQKFENRCASEPAQVTALSLVGYVVMTQCCQAVYCLFVADAGNAERTSTCCTGHATTKQ